MKVRVGGAWRDVTSAKVRVGGAWRDMATAEAYEGGAWREVLAFTTPLSVNVSPVSVIGEREGAGEATTDPATATPTGGTAPYTYAWTKVSGGSITADTGLLASTTFSAILTNGQIITATFQCTVTDARGQTATDTVNVILESNSGL